VERGEGGARGDNCRASDCFLRDRRKKRKEGEYCGQEGLIRRKRGGKPSSWNHAQGKRKRKKPVSAEEKDKALKRRLYPVKWAREEGGEGEKRKRKAARPGCP